MNKFLGFVIAGSLIPLSLKAELKNGTNEFIELDGIKYEILDTDSKEVGVSIQNETCPFYITIPNAIIQKSGDAEIVYTVTQINNEAFKNNKNIYWIEFANTITEIGDRAFEGCTIINFDELPQQLTTIGDYAFHNCDAITRIKLPETVEVLGEGCFSEMASLKRAILFGKLQELPLYVLRSNLELEEVYLPENLKKIGDGAFDGDVYLEDMTLPPTLEEIGDWALSGIARIKKIVLPSSVKKIGKNSFFHNDLYSIDLGDLETIPDNAFDCCFALKEVVFPRNLKSIGNRSFASCAMGMGRSMATLVIPDEVETLEENAFAESQIISLTIGEGIKNLPKGSCGIPHFLHLGSNIYSIAREAFDPQNLKIISSLAKNPPLVENGFPLSVEELNKITLIVPDEESKSNYSKHQYWKDFNILVANNDLVSIELDGSQDIASAIYNTSGLMPSEVTRLSIKGTLTDKDFEILKNNMISLTYLDLGNTNNTVIPEVAFQGNKLIEDIILPQNLIRIENQAFENCVLLKIPELPNGIEYIGSAAFNNCQSLNISKMPKALKEIDFFAFYDCVSLKHIVFEDNLEKLNGYTFAWCDNLEYVDMSKATKLKDLSYDTFADALALSVLKLPDSIESIGSHCIVGTQIRVLDLPKSLKTLGEQAMENNIFRVITFGEGIEELPRNGLAHNSKLLSVNFPSSLKKLHEDTFIESPKISAISCLASDAPEASANTFSGINTRNCVLSVPVNSFYSYLSAPGWGMFSNIENVLEINIPEDIEITTIYEEDYQDIVEEEESKLRSLTNTINVLTASQSRGVSLTFPEHLSIQSYSNQISDIQSLIDGSKFCKLNNGTLLASEKIENSKGQRIFIKSKNGEPIYSVKINGIEKISELDSRNSLVIPVGSEGMLVINDGFKEIVAEEVILNKTSLSLELGKSFRLTAKVLPEETTDPTVKWSSNKEELATVSEDGLVTAISAGEVIITAFCGEVSASCQVTVIDEAGIESLLANPDSKISVYTVEGVLIKKECSLDELKTLPKGIYIIVSGKDRYKIAF